MSKKIIDLPSGSITDFGLVYIGDPITGTLNKLSYKQVKDYAQSGFVSFDPTQIYQFSSSILNFTSSYYIDSASFINNIRNVFSSESNYLSTSSFNSFTSSIVTTSSFNTFSSSYVTDSSSFNLRINNIPGTGSLLPTSSFQVYTASNETNVSNVYASESNYLPTASFNTFSGSYHTDSASFLTKIANAGSIISNLDGTLTISPISGSVTASLNLGNVNTWTAAQTYLLTSLGATPTSNVLVRNTTSASVSLNQISPSILWESQGWKTTAVAGSQPVQYRMYASAATGTTQALQNFGLNYNVNGSAFQAAFTITYDGSGQVFRVYQHADGTGQYSAVYLTNSGGTQTGGMLGVNQSGEVRFGGFNGGGYFMTMYANNVERARIVASTGNYLINTTTDDTINKLQVNGTVISTQYKLSALNAAPTSVSGSGSLGEIRVVSGSTSAIYVCVSTNHWLCSTLTTF